MSLSDLDETYKKTEPGSTLGIEPGWYRMRVISVAEAVSSKGTDGIRLGLVFVEPPYEGSILHRDFWFTGGALPISKRDLETLGFVGQVPSEIAARHVFDDLPEVLAQVGYRLYQGRRLLQVISFVRADATLESRPSGETRMSVAL